jgi:hypothetical protein
MAVDHTTTQVLKLCHLHVMLKGCSRTYQYTSTTVSEGIIVVVSQPTSPFILPVLTSWLLGFLERYKTCDAFLLVPFSC